MSLICTGKNVDVLTSGEYQAVCSQVVDLGQQKNIFTKANGEKEEKCGKSRYSQNVPLL